MAQGVIYVFDLSQEYNGKKVVKIGRTFIQENETTVEVQNRLVKRYRTCCVDPVMLDGVVVTDNVEAEKLVFKLLKNLNISRELYYYDEKKITRALDKVYRKLGVESEHEVERIIGYNFETGCYQIKWAGCDEVTMEPYENLSGCLELVDEFAKRHILII